MATNVQIQFNPFQQQLNILIDGKQLSEYSCLIQFADEDIWQWHSEILDALYNELQDNFLLTLLEQRRIPKSCALHAKRVIIA